MTLFGLLAVLNVGFNYTRTVQKRGAEPRAGNWFKSGKPRPAGTRIQDRREWRSLPTLHARKSG